MWRVCLVTGCQATCLKPTAVANRKYSLFLWWQPFRLTERYLWLFGIGQCVKWGANWLNPVEDCPSQRSIMLTCYSYYPQLLCPCRCWVAVWQPRQQLVWNISTYVPVVLAYQLHSWRDNSCLSHDGAWLVVVEIWKLKNQVLLAQLNIPGLVQNQVSLFFLAC